MRLTARQLEDAMMAIAREFRDRPLTPAEQWTIDYQDALTFAKRHGRTEGPRTP